MQSNSKLTAEQKADLKLLKKHAKSNGTRIHSDATTIAYKIHPKTVEFSLAVMSDNETKFRPNVGKYYALTRFNNGQTVTMAKNDFVDMAYHIFGLNMFD